MEFRLDELNQLYFAARRAFTSAQLETLVAVRFGEAYEDIVSPSYPADYRVRKLVEYFNARYEIERLVAALRDARPSVPDLTKLAAAAGLIQLPDEAVLQALPRPTAGGTIGQDPAEFRRKLAMRENSVCRIVIDGQRFGTGMLIGEDLVLTNHHVVANGFAADGSRQRTVICEFDYRMGASGVATPATPVAATRLRASSPHALADLATNPANESPEYLDYAIVELERPFASDPIIDGGEPRGRTRLADNVPAPGIHAGVLILEHPNAQPMRLDLGSVTWLNPARLRHSARTLKGSSGSPIFDADLTPIALHHAGYDWPDSEHPVNQAIPIPLILADARAKGVAI